MGDDDGGGSNCGGVSSNHQATCSVRHHKLKPAYQSTTHHAHYHYMTALPALSMSTSPCLPPPNSFNSYSFTPTPTTHPPRVPAGDHQAQLVLQRHHCTLLLQQRSMQALNLTLWIWLLMHAHGHTHKQVATV